MTNRVVWHLISNRWNSAITEYALSAAGALEAVGFHSVFSPLRGSPAETRAREDKLETLPLDDFSPLSVFQVRRLARQIRPDKVILYGGPETFLARFIDGSAGKIRFYGQDAKAKNVRFSRFFECSIAHLEALLAPNRSVFHQIRSLAPRKVIKEIVLGLRSRPAILDEKRNNEIVILGRLDPVKGHERAIRIFSRLLQILPTNSPRPCLHVIGEPANLSEEFIQSCAKRYGLERERDFRLSAVRVLSVSELMTRAAVGWISSLGSEHICRVAEEFLLLGTPVYVSGAGATEEVLFEGAGESYRGSSEEAAARKLLGLFHRSVGESPAERLQRVKRARERFSLEVMGRRLAELIV